MRLEVVCQSVEDCLLAERAGASRIEFVSAIELGGLSPTPIAVGAATARCKTPLLVMVRPRPGGFCYSADERETLLYEAEFWMNVAESQGALGIVTGALDENGAIDAKTLAKVAKNGPSGELVCHRCFDATPDPFAAMETLIDLGFTRILTSGQAKRALEGAELLLRLKERAQNRIEILPAGGIRAENAPKLLELLGPSDLHVGAFVEQRDPTHTAVDYGPHLALDEAAVAALVQLMQS